MIKKLIGNDVDIETSLKEYGLAWTESKTEYHFYYGIRVDDNCSHDRFDWSDVSKDIDIREEYSWADFDAVNSFVGGGFFELSLPQQITDLISYYGSENVFGSSYTEGMTYRDVLNNTVDGITDIVQAIRALNDSIEYANNNLNIGIYNRMERITLHHRVGALTHGIEKLSLKLKNMIESGVQ